MGRGVMTGASLIILLALGIVSQRRNGQFAATPMMPDNFIPIEVFYANPTLEVERSRLATSAHRTTHGIVSQPKTGRRKVGISGLV